MRIAVMSDSHDNIWNLGRALKMIQQENAEMIIHCGDFVAPFMLSELEQAGIPIHGVFGNNDGDQFKLTTLALCELSNITLHGLIGQVDINDFHICFTHLPEVAEGLACSGKYDLVCCGHSHTYLQKRINRTFLLNPGEIMGKEGCPSFCLVETETGQIRRRFLDQAPNPPKAACG